MTKKVLLNYYFTSKPKAVKFSPNSKLLVLGLENGELLIFIIVRNHDSIQLTQIQKFQDLKTSIYSL